MNKAIFGVLLLSCCVAGCNKPVLSTLSETANNDVSAIKAKCRQEADDWRARVGGTAYDSPAVQRYPDTTSGSVASLYGEADDVYRDCLRRNGIADAQ